jgi:Fe-S-cluster-containing dehydrogenase component
MAKKRIILNFPANLIDQPITYHLVKDYNLLINILQARITPKEEGRMLLEVSGKKKDIDEGMRYLSEKGVGIQPLEKDVNWDSDSCIHCTACTTFCPSGALVVDRDTMLVSFLRDKCIACELCIPVCSYRAIAISH